MNPSKFSNYDVNKDYDGSGFDQPHRYDDFYDDIIEEEYWETDVDSVSAEETDIKFNLNDGIMFSNAGSPPGFYPSLYTLYSAGPIANRSSTSDEFYTGSNDSDAEGNESGAEGNESGAEGNEFGPSEVESDEVESDEFGPSEFGPSEFGPSEFESDEFGPSEVESDEVESSAQDIEVKPLSERRPPTLPQLALLPSPQPPLSITRVTNGESSGPMEVTTPATPPEVQVRVAIATKHGLVHDWVDHGQLTQHLYRQTAPEVPRRQLAELTLTCVEDYVGEDIMQTWSSYPGNQPPLETDKPMFWTWERRRKRKYIVEGVETIKNAFRNPVAPYIRNVPFALVLPAVACAIVRANHSSYGQEVQALTSETLPGYVDGQKVITEWPTVGQARGLDTIDSHLLQRANYYNGRIFFTCRPDLYLHQSHQYLGLCRAKSKYAVTGNYLLSGFNYHSLLPRETFAQVDDYLQQRTALVNPAVAPTKRLHYWRAAIRKRRCAAHRRRQVCSYTYLGLHADAPRKLDAVYSPYAVPNLRRLLPAAYVDDVTIFPCEKPPRHWFDVRRFRAYQRLNLRRHNPCRWTLCKLGLRRQGHPTTDPWNRNRLTLWPDRRRRQGYGRIKFHLRWHAQDRASRLEQFGRVTHQALCDGLPNLGARRSAHYHLYNNVLKWRQFLGQTRNETTYPELFTWVGFLEYPQRRQNRYEQFRRDRHLVDITIEEMQDFGGQVFQEWDNEGKPVYALEIDTPRQQRTYRQRQRELGEAIVRIHDQVRGLSTEMEQDLLAWPRLLHDDDTETAFEVQWRFWDRLYMHGPIRRVLLASNNDARLYGLCHQPWSRRLGRFDGLVTAAKVLRADRLRRGLLIAKSDQLYRLSSGVAFPDNDGVRLRTLLLGWRDPAECCGDPALHDRWAPHSVSFEIRGAPKEIARNYMRALSSPDWWSGFVAGHTVAVTDDHAKDHIMYGAAEDDFGSLITYDGPAEAEFSHSDLTEEKYSIKDAAAEDRRLDEPHYDERGSSERHVIVDEHWGPDLRGGFNLLSGTPYRAHALDRDRHNGMVSGTRHTRDQDALAHEGHLAGQTYADSGVSYTQAVFDHLKEHHRLGQLQWMGARQENPLVDGYRLKHRRTGDVRRLRLGQLNWMLNAARKESRAEVMELLGRRDARLERELTQTNFIQRLEDATEPPEVEDLLEHGEHSFGQFEGEDPDAFKVRISLDDEEELEDDSQLDFVDYHTMNPFEYIEDEYDVTRSFSDPYDPDTAVWNARHRLRTNETRASHALKRDRRLFDLPPAPKVRDEFWRGRVSDSPVQSGVVHHPDHVSSNYLVRLNRLDILSDIETAARVPWWVSAYQIYLFSRLIRVADRFQDRYALAIFIFVHDLFHEFKVGSFRHLTAQNDLVVSPRHRQGFRELVGSGELLGEFGPTIRYLQASRLNWIPLQVHRPRADYHGQASGRSNAATPHGAAPRGILLVGPPGTGKTHLIKALAAESKVEAIVYGRERYYARVSLGPRGEFGPALQVVNLFDIARQESPCLVFIDEIDGLGPDRRHVVSDDGVSLSGGHMLTRRRDFVKLNAFDQWLERTGHAHPSFNLIKTTSWHWRVTNPTLYNEVYTVKAPRVVTRTKMSSLNTLDEVPGFENPPLGQVAMLTLGHLLTHIDGFDIQNNVVVGATNRPRALDPALVRPGRLNKIVFLDLPSRQRRFDLLTFLSVNRETGVNRDAEPIDWDYFSRRTSGLSPAHLRAALNFSILRSAYRMVQSGLADDDPSAIARHDRASVRYGLRNVEARNSVQGWQRQLRRRLGRDMYAYGHYYQGVGGGYAILHEALNRTQLVTLQMDRGTVIVDKSPGTLFITPPSNAGDAFRAESLTLSNSVLSREYAGAETETDAGAETETDAGADVRTTVIHQTNTIIVRPSYLWDFVRSRETQQRLSEARPDYVKEREKRTLTLRRERRRNVTGRTSYASDPDERARSYDLRKGLYNRLGKQIRRAYLLRAADTASLDVDHRDAIAEVANPDEDTLESLGQYTDFGRRILKHHLFGTTMLRHSSFATSDLVSPRRNPYYVVRGAQLIRSQVHLSRYAMTCVLMGHLTHRRDRTVLPLGLRVQHVQKPLLEDAYGLQRIAYHTAAKALVRARLGVPDDEERVYRLWEPLRNQEMPPTERTFVQAVMKKCFTRREFAGVLATLMSGRAGERAYLDKFGVTQSDLGRQESKQAGWLINIMVENNLFVRGQFAFLKQNAIEGLQVRRNRTQGVKKARQAGLHEEQLDRRDNYQINRYFIDRAAVHQPRHGLKAESEFWWSEDLARHRRRKAGALYTRYYESAPERRRWPWVENLYNLNAGVDRAALRPVGTQARGSAYDALVTQFLTELRVGSNQQLLSASDSERAQLMFEVYDQLVHFFNSHRSVYDHLVFQLMTRDELDETQTSRQLEQLMIVKKLGKAVCRELRGHRRLLNGGDVVDASTVTEPTVTEPTGADVSGPQAFRSGSFLIQPKPDDDAPTVGSDDETAATESDA
jgi:hypothetical protein